MCSCCNRRCRYRLSAKPLLVSGIILYWIASPRLAVWCRTRELSDREGHRMVEKKKKTQRFSVIIFSSGMIRGGDGKGRKKQGQSMVHGCFLARIFWHSIILAVPASLHNCTSPFVLQGKTYAHQPIHSWL